MCRNRSFAEKVKQRIRVLWVLFALMVVYMVTVGELGLGDSRMMTDLAQMVSRVIFFGGMIFVITRIVRNKSLLSNQTALVAQEKERLDERRQFLHDKSGGVVADILLFVLLFTTCTTALWNMPAFYVSLSILMVTIVLKTASYFIFDKLY